MPSMSSVLVFAALAMTSSLAQADELSFTLAPHEARAGIVIDVPQGAKLLTVRLVPDVAPADGEAAPLVLGLRPDSDFDLHDGDVYRQAAFYSLANTGEASIHVGSYSSPALHAGTWYAGVVNTSNAPVPVTLITSTRASSEPDTEFVLHFDAPSQALVDASGGADQLDCDVAPWADDTAAGSSTLGEVRKSLLRQAAAQLGAELHSPVPVDIQACWKEFDDSGAHAGNYTLAASTGTYLFASTPDSPVKGLPVLDTWYSMAPTARLAGTRVCNLTSDVDCSIPDIIIWYNSAEVAVENYDQPADAALIVAVTMHEITHGLGFLSQVSVADVYDDDDDPETDDVPNPDFGKFFHGMNDAYTANVGFIWEPDPAATGNPAHALDHMVSFADLAVSDRQRALASIDRLVWMGNRAAASTENYRRDQPYPFNLVQLHAPSTIQPGSTLSHLGPNHYGQLMTAVIQPNFPDTLGLAKPMLEHAGWNTEPVSSTGPAGAPTAGTWFDPEHSGHGIDLQRAILDPVHGDVYTAVFYTYDAQGDSEYYLAVAHFKNGQFASASAPVPLVRPLYSPAQGKGIADPNSHGSLSIDFSAAAAADPACAGHTGPSLAVMHWAINADSGAWCIAPTIGDAYPVDPAIDLNGLWYAGNTDTGWGLTVGEQDLGGSLFMAPILLYYYGTDNQPHWVTGEFGDYTPGMTTNLYKVSGYCRTCAKVPTTTQVIGSINVDLNAPDGAQPPSGENTLSINVNGGGSLRFMRSSVPVSLISLPPGT